MADIEAIKKLKLAELRKELTDRGLSSKGNKAELVERLTEYLEVAGADAVLEDTDAVLTAEDEAEDLLNPDEELDEEEEETPATRIVKHEEKLLELDGGVAAEEAPVARKVQLEAEPEEETEEKTTVTEVRKVISPPSKPMTDNEKKALRAQKFGVTAPLSDADKKKARAERFGMQAASGSQSKTGKTTTTPSTGLSMSVDAEKLKQRAERFGKSVSPTAIKNEEAERLRKRKERFGAVVVSAPGSKAKISANGNDDVEAKKRKRAERFGMA